MSHRLTETVPLAEAGETTPSGRMHVQAISAGLGSSGYYSPEVLERAARDRLITRGTPVHLDHPSASERQDRPERSVQTIAGVFTGDATYDADRQALVGEVQFFTPWKERIAEMAPYIGLSISGSATDITEGEHEGRPVPVVEGLAAIDSVDLVTRAGRGGQFLATVHESARPEAALIEHITAAFGPALTEAGLHITTTNTPIVPATRPGSTTTTEESEEDTMPNIEESELARLREDAGRVTALEERATTAESERDEARRQLAETRRTARAHTIVAERAAEQRVEFTALERRGLMADLPLTEAGDLDEAAFTTTVNEAAAAALEARGAGRVSGFGGQPPEQPTLSESDIDAAVGGVFGRQVKEA